MSFPNFTTLNICLWAGPGVGKSVSAASLFCDLKLAGIATELVTEAAKPRQYDGTLGHTPQIVILKDQLRMLMASQGWVEAIVTDAPPAISLLYAKPEELEEVHELLVPTAMLKTWNVLLHRDLDEGYETTGRWQSKSQAKAFHDDVVVPFVRQQPSDMFLELHVSEVKSRLLPLLQHVLRNRAKDPQ